MTDLLTTLETRERELSEALAEVRAELARERLRIVQEKYGIQPGSIVTRRGKSYRIARIEDWSSGGKPWVKGNPQRKDGSYGTAERNLFSDWEVAT